MPRANANSAGRGRVGVNFRSRSHRAGLLDGSSSPQTTWNPSDPLPCFTNHLDHVPLEISNRFQSESKHPSRNKVGNSLWLFIPNTKTLDKILKYKIQKLKQSLFGYLMDHIEGHGQQPPPPILSPNLFPCPEGIRWPPSRGSLNKVSSRAASIAVIVNPSQTPRRLVHSLPTGPLVHFIDSARV